MTIAIHREMTSWMLARIKRETQGQQAAADADRLEPLGCSATVASYTSYLAHIYGVEAPSRGLPAQIPSHGAPSRV